MIECRTASASDIKHVVSNMWNRGANEMTVYGIDYPERIFEFFRKESDEHSLCFAVEDEPVAVFGAYLNKDDATYYTWFSATKDFVKVGREATFKLRRLIKDRKANHPKELLYLLTAVDHPQAERWFKAIGFDRVEDQMKLACYKYRH